MTGCSPSSLPQRSAEPNPKCRSRHVPGIPRVPPCGTSPEPWSDSARVSGAQRMNSARSALPSCLKTVTSRCAAHRCARSRTRFRCAAPFRDRAALRHFGGCALLCLSTPFPSSRPQRSGEPGSSAYPIGRQIPGVLGMTPGGERLAPGRPRGGGGARGPIRFAGLRDRGRAEAEERTVDRETRLVRHRSRGVLVLRDSCEAHAAG